MERKTFIISAGGAVAAVSMQAKALAASPAMPAFDFSSNLWLSLHHTLYRQSGALLDSYSGGLKSLSGLQQRFYDEIDRIPADSREAWYNALSTYGNRYSGRSFVFDDEMVRIENQLSDGDVPEQLRGTFASVAPIYRGSLWPTHNAANEKWIAVQRAHLAAIAAPLASRLSKIYGVPWLRIPYRIATVPSTDRDSAFSNFGTKSEYFLIVTSSMDSANEGWQGFETLFHEASHSIVGPSIKGIAVEIASAAESMNRPVPTDLWHAFIMYTPGAVLKSLLAQRGIADYVSSFDSVLTDFYPRYYVAFKEHWQPYVDGKAPRSNAIRSVVAAVVS